MPGPFDSPVMAMYMADRLAAVEQMVPPDRAALRTRWYVFLTADLVFLVAYGVMFLVLAVELRRRGGRGDRPAGTLGMVAAALTALLDVSENTAIAGALFGSATMAGWIRLLSLGKYTALGATALALSWLFFQPRPD